MHDKQQKSLYMTVLMTPEMENFSGAVHGGALLRLLDQVAYACAARYCQSYVVTVFLDLVHFKQPVRVGELASFKANVNYTGRTSLEVGVRVIAENLTTHEQRHCLSCYFTMVAKDEEGNTRPVPPLVIEHEIERKLFEAGEMRRQMRDEIRKRNQGLRVGGLDTIRPA